VTLGAVIAASLAAIKTLPQHKQELILNNRLKAAVQILVATKSRIILISLRELCDPVLIGLGN
jgi:hypothetical protein